MNHQSLVGGNIPKGWAWASLAEIAEINRRDPELRRLPDDLQVSFVPMAAVDAKAGVIADPQTRPLKDVRKGFTPFSNGDVIIAKITPSMENGKAAIARDLVNGRAFGSTEFHVFTTRSTVLPEFLFHYIRQERFRRDAKAHFAGTAGQLRVPESFLLDYPIPLPPLVAQQRIVARIEELLSDLDAGVAALERVRVGLKRYWASVLDAAVAGRLLAGSAALGEGQLPQGWRWTTVQELAADEPNSITDGPFGSNLKTEHYREEGPRVIRLQNIGDGEFRDEEAHISPEHFQKLRRHQIFAGDLVIAGLGETLPRACMIPEYVGEAIVKADCIRFKPNPGKADNRYLLYALNSNAVRTRVVSIAHGIGRPRMNQQEIKAIPIPLPPPADQRQIAAEVERRLSVAQQVETAVEAGLLRAARLRQAVLKAAFEGRLVSTWQGT